MLRIAQEDILDLMAQYPSLLAVCSAAAGVGPGGGRALLSGTW
jgi:hypothetical protein